jgi:hypothetical protein
MGGGRGRKAVYRKTSSPLHNVTKALRVVSTQRSGKMELLSFKSEIGTSNNRGSFGEAVEEIGMR